MLFEPDKADAEGQKPSPSNGTTNRLAWIDVWKGALILLVVFGHVLGGASHVAAGWAHDLCALGYKVIYFFHMPAFFWIAGRCWKPSPPGGGYLNFVRRRAQRLLVPYAVFGVASAAVYVLAGGDAAALAAQARDSYYAGMGGGTWTRHLLSLLHAGGWPDGEGFRCNSVLWFLPALFTVSCLYWLFDRLLPSRRGQLAVAVLLLPLSWLLCRASLPCLPWGLSLVPWYLPFVVFGRWLRPEKVSFRWRGAGIALTVAWLVYAVCAGAEPNTRRGVWHFGWFLAFTGMTFGGLVLSVWTVRRIGGRLAGVFASLGIASLGVMLLHKFLVLGLQLKVAPLREALGRGGLATVAAVLAVGLLATAGSWALSRLPGIRRLVSSR